METPDWINKNLFETSLKKYFLDDGLKIVLFSIKLATSVGENYTTYVYRIKITYTRSNSLKEEKLSLILKCMREGLMEGLVQELNMFTKEIDMFLTVLPEMSKAYGANVISANCIKASMTPTPCLMMQDMCVLGFKVHKRQCGLDLQHTLMLLEKMAIFHATSYVAYEKNSSMLTKMYQKGLYPKVDGIVAWIKQGLEMIAELTVTSKEFSPYHDKIKTVLESDYIERCLASWRRNEGEFSVLNHGDSWINNMMFSYDENGCVNDCRYLDYQLSIYSSPAVDLHYFMSTSLANDVIQDIDHLLDFYYIRLLMNLNKLKCKLKEVPSLKEFKDDFRRRSFYGLIAMATVLPLVRADSRTDATFEELLSSEASENGFRYHCYNNNYYKGALLLLLPIYDKLGVFS